MPKAKTWEQYKTECEAVAKPGVTVLGWVGEWRGCHTKVKCTCTKHGEWCSTSITNFLVGCGCPRCKHEAIKGGIQMPDATHIAQFMSTGKFKEGTNFKRNLNKSDKPGQRTYWDYTCPVCSKDEYTQAGLCNGVFTAQIYNLKMGKLACRCSKAYRYTKEQWEYRLTKECENRGYVFVGWKGKSWGDKSKFIYECQQHGEQNATPNYFLTGSGCPLCAGHNQQQCYINVVKDGDLPVALKIGIAKDSDVRLKRQNVGNLFQMGRLALYNFTTIEECKAAEQECKTVLERGIVSKQDMPDGWTETVALTDYDKVVSIYERFGGVLVQEEK